MRISVALCTYNGAIYLNEQLQSLMRQSRLPDELIICDDASTDDTLTIARGFADQAPFVTRIFANADRVGTSKNFERALIASSGDIIALCDQDDVWLHNKLAKLSFIFAAHPQAGYVFSDALVVDKHLKPLNPPQQLWSSVGFTDEDIEMFCTCDATWQVQRLLRRTLVTGTTMAFRSHLRKFILPIPSEWVHDAWISLVLSIFGWYGVPINAALVQYRQHESQQLGVRSGLAIHSPQVNNVAKFKIFRGMNKSDKLSKRLESLKAMQVLAQHLLTLQNVEGTLPDSVIQVVNAYIQHSQDRVAAYQATGLRRWRIILSSLFSGNYHIYSNRYSSIIKDTFT